VYLFVQDLREVMLTREQSDLVGTGYAGPAVDFNDVKLTVDQVTDFCLVFWQVLGSLNFRK
jgi:hypothetical protein